MDTTAALMRDFGMQQVQQHQTTEWRVAYNDAITAWFESLPAGSEFIGEEMRQAVEPITGQPTHVNAWGAMAGSALRRWTKTERVALVGVRRATVTSSHARLYPLYRKNR
jgi:hypothetical protein